MNFGLSTLTNPAYRDGLEDYYSKMKADAVEAWKERPALPDEISITTPDGEVMTGKAIHVTAEQMEKAFVSFDDWLGTMIDMANSRANTLAMAEKQMSRLEASNPDNSSSARATFSVGDTLLAYVNADGTLVTSNGAQEFLGDVEAEASGLEGDARIAFLTNRIEAILSELFPELSVETYDEASSPSLRAFADRWYPNHDADALYNDAMTEAQARLDELRQQQAQWQNRLYDIQGFLMEHNTPN